MKYTCYRKNERGETNIVDDGRGGFWTVRVLVLIVDTNTIAQNAYEAEGMYIEPAQ